MHCELCCCTENDLKNRSINHFLFLFAQCFSAREKLLIVREFWVVTFTRKKPSYSLRISWRKFLHFTLLSLNPFNFPYIHLIYITKEQYFRAFEKMALLQIKYYYWHIRLIGNLYQDWLFSLAMVAIIREYIFSLFTEYLHGISAEYLSSKSLYIFAYITLSSKVSR